MRKNTRLSRQIPHLLEKAERLYKANRHRAINFEIDGKRICGKDMSNLALSEKNVKFYVGEQHFTIELKDIVNVKRLRTRKFLFFVEFAMIDGDEPIENVEEIQEEIEECQEQIEEDLEDAQEGE